MIFKTIQNDLGQTKIGIDGAVNGLLDGSFFKRQNLLSDKDISALQAYNAELNKIIGYSQQEGRVVPIYTSAQTAFNRTMQDASDIAIKMAENANGSAVEINNITTASKASTIAMKGLAMAGNLVVSTLASMAISLVVTEVFKAIDNYIHSAERTTESLEEMANTLANTSKELEDLNTRLLEVESNIKELQSLSDAGTISVADEKQLEILKAENKELLTNIALLEDKQKREAEEAVMAIGSTKDDYTYQYSDATSQWHFTKTSAADALEKYINSYSDWKDSAQAENNKKYMDEALAGVIATINAYKKLEKTQGSLDETQQAEYDNALRVQQLYLEHVYALNGTESAYRALNKETQKKILNDKLLTQFSQEYVDAILSSISPSQYADLWDKDFSFDIPDINDYDSAEEYGKAYAETWLKGVEEKIGSSSINENPITTSDSIKQLKNLEDKMSSLKNAYTSLFEGKKADLSSLDGIRESFEELKTADMTVVNNALEEIANSTSLEQAQSSMNALCDEYVKASGILDNLTEDNKELISARLKEIGVTNADAVVTDLLTAKMQAATLELEKYKNAELSQIKATDSAGNSLYSKTAALLDNAQMSTEAKGALLNLVAQMTIFNNTNLSVASKIEALKELATAAGITADSLNLSKVSGMGYDPRYYNKASIQSSFEDAVKAKFGAYSYTPAKYTPSTSNSSSGSSSNNKPEKFDWIEKKIKSIQEKISKLGKTVSATYKIWGTRNNSLIDEMRTVGEEIDIQQKAYNAYMSSANSVGLSGYYKDLVRNGAYSIEEISDETLREQIQEYEDLYNKALACENAIEDLHGTLAELAKTKFQNVSQKFEEQIGFIKHSSTMLENLMNINTAKGYVESAKYYKELINIEKNNISQLKTERTELTKAMQEAVNNGNIEIYSSDWYEMANSILEVDEAIQNATSSTIEFLNKMQEINWAMFDKKQDFINQVKEESDFINELMDNEKLFEDNGNWTNLADARGGLYAVNYNIAMAQADEYASEIEKINKELEKDPYNDTLLTRRKELLDLQRESIKTAETEKQNIKNLYSEGYDKMLDYLQKMIDKRNELLQAEKDLYDYEKNIGEQTKTIASYEKQLESFAEDDSEETQSKIQQLKVSLEEARENLEQTEYDKWLSDQQQMLDSMMSEAETWVNQRLDSLDLLVREMVASTNDKADEIGNTLSEVATDVGYTLSDNIATIFNGEGSISSVVADYGKQFTDGLTSTNETLNSIREFVQKMYDASDAKAKESKTEVSTNVSKVPSATNNSSANANANKSNTTSQPSKSTGSSSASGSWGSWFKSKYAGSQSLFAKTKDISIVDRLKYYSFDSAFSARAQYYKAMGGNGTYTGSYSQNTWMIQQMKKNGYANGSKRILKDELAWTQENGQELMYRASDGALLTRLSPGDAVFTNDMTNTLWKFAKDPGMFTDIIKTSAIVPKSNNTGSVNNDIVMNISLPNVQRPEDFVNELKTNKQFEKLVQTMTLGTAMKGNSLNKFKIK